MKHSNSFLIGAMRNIPRVQTLLDHSLAQPRVMLGILPGRSLRSISRLRERGRSTSLGKQELSLYSFSGREDSSREFDERWVRHISQGNSSTEEKPEELIGLLPSSGPNSSFSPSNVITPESKEILLSATGDTNQQGGQTSEEASACLK